MSTPRGMIAPWTRSTPSASRNGTYRSSRCRRRTHGREPSSRRTLDPEIVGAGQVMDLDTFWSVTSTTAMVVVVDGVVVYERYADGVAPTDRLLGNSATKSVLALLTGVAWADGSLGDLDTPVVQHVPELSGSGYDRVTVRQVLTMTSGVAWREDYHDPDSVASRFVRRWRDGTGGTRDHLSAIGTEVAPGSRYMYCSPDSHGPGLGARASDRTAVRRGADADSGSGSGPSILPSSVWTLPPMPAESRSRRPTSA